MTTVDVLRKAKALLQEKGWIQGEFAKDAGGNMCSPFEQAAACFCAWGAIRRAAADGHAETGPSVDALVRAVEGDVPTALSLVDWNDAPGQQAAAVLAAFDRAIALAEQEAAHDNG